MTTENRGRQAVPPVNDGRMSLMPLAAAVLGTAAIAAAPAARAAPPTQGQELSGGPLDQVSQAANVICQRPLLDGSENTRTAEVEFGLLTNEAQKSLDDVIGTLDRMGVKGVAKFKTSKSAYRGVLQRDLAEAIAKGNECALTVVALLKDRLLVVGISQAGLSGKNKVAIDVTNPPAGDPTIRINRTAVIVDGRDTDAWIVPDESRNYHESAHYVIAGSPKALQIFGEGTYGLTVTYGGKELPERTFDVSKEEFRRLRENQAIRPWQLQLEVGLAEPEGAAAELLDRGWSAGIGALWHPDVSKTIHPGLRVTADYTRFDTTHSTESIDGLMIAQPSEPVSAFSLRANALAQVTVAYFLRLYVTAGIGGIYDNARGNLVRSDSSYSVNGSSYPALVYSASYPEELHFAVNVGGGLDIGPSQSVFVEATYERINEMGQPGTLQVHVGYRLPL